MIPLFVDCSGRQIVIFGGGEVAARKASYFLNEAKILVVSRSFSQKMAALPVERRVLDVRTVPDEVIATVVERAFVVIGAISDRTQNNRINAICRAKGILFNNADGEAGDVIIPSRSGGKNYTLAISTHGHSPAVSRFIREYLEKHLPSLDEMVALHHDLREELKQREPSLLRRKVILREVLSDPVLWETLARDPKMARTYAREKYLHE